MPQFIWSVIKVLNYQVFWYWGAQFYNSFLKACQARESWVMLFVKYLLFKTQLGWGRGEGDLEASHNLAEWCASSHLDNDVVKGWLRDELGCWWLSIPH